MSVSVPVPPRAACQEVLFKQVSGFFFMRVFATLGIPSPGGLKPKSVSFKGQAFYKEKRNTPGTWCSWNL